MSDSKSDRWVDVPLVLQVQVRLTGTFIINLLYKAPILFVHDIHLAENLKINPNPVFLADTDSVLYKKEQNI